MSVSCRKSPQWGPSTPSPICALAHPQESLAKVACELRGRAADPPGTETRVGTCPCTPHPDPDRRELPAADFDAVGDRCRGVRGARRRHVRRRHPSLTPRPLPRRLPPVLRDTVLNRHRHRPHPLFCRLCMRKTYQANDPFWLRPASFTARAIMLALKNEADRERKRAY